MDLHEFCEQFNTDLGFRKYIFVLCNCCVDYIGRSRAVIGEGDRVILIKPDTTLLIHSPEGFKPLNWMGSPCDTVCELEGDVVLVHSQRTKNPYEEMKIKISGVKKYYAADGVCDRGNLCVAHTEKDMQKYLANHPKLVDPGFRVKATEYPTPLGNLDLYGKIGAQYTVVELKAVRAGLPAALQVIRYKQWLSDHLKREVKAFLMAPSATPNTLKLLKKNSVEFRKFDIKKVKPKLKPKTTLSKWMADE
ncbi:MAG: DUF91 domain-containing protein [Candidatus Altiarchaeales archaeon]|nr:DUF91 domain-containing protein [Candidatus Altiarchaeales archaeon]